MKTLELEDHEIAKINVACEIRIDFLLLDLKDAIANHENIDRIEKDIRDYNIIIRKLEAVAKT